MLSKLSGTWTLHFQSALHCLWSQEFANICKIPQRAHPLARSSCCSYCRLSYGGSLIRPESTGYGLVYFTEFLLQDKGESIKVRPHTRGHGSCQGLQLGCGDQRVGSSCGLVAGVVYLPLCLSLTAELLLDKGESAR